MSAALTIVSGLALLVLGQIIVRSFIDPVYELRKLRGKIAGAPICHTSTYINPASVETPENEAARHALRSLGSKLEALSHAVPFYRLFALTRAVPSLSSVEEARSNLIGFSNSLSGGNIEYNERRWQEIIEALHRRIPG